MGCLVVGLVDVFKEKTTHTHRFMVSETGEDAP